MLPRNVYVHIVLTIVRESSICILRVRRTRYSTNSLYTVYEYGTEVVLYNTVYNWEDLRYVQYYLGTVLVHRIQYLGPIYEHMNDPCVHARGRVARDECEMKIWRYEEWRDEDMKIS